MATSTKSRKAAPVKRATRKKPIAKKPTAVAADNAPKVAPQNPIVSAPAPKLASVTDQVVVVPDLKKKELIDLVVARSGIKKKDAKPVVEAMLAVLGETIASGRELNLKPLGKLRINRSTDKGNGRVIICKLRQSYDVQSGPKDTLAAHEDTL